jgi:hypothetical protein
MAAQAARLGRPQAAQELATVLLDLAASRAHQPTRCEV